jgi:hypothetical protein
MLSDEGIAVLQQLCIELEPYARSTERLPKFLRGLGYHSEFIRGFYSDPDVLEHLTTLAQAPLEPHPVTHHAAHVNYAPEELGRNVDQWHEDVVSFDFVLMVTDPTNLRGGRFEWFHGSVEEGRDLLLQGLGLPPERVHQVEFPGAGFAVLQQGHRILHRATRLEEPQPRTTMVCSYYSPHSELDDPTELPTLRKIDGRDVALLEWSRYAAVVAQHNLTRFVEATHTQSMDLPELRTRLHASIVDVLHALEDFDSDDRGRMISYGDGDE